MISKFVLMLDYLGTVVPILNFGKAIVQKHKKITVSNLYENMLYNFYRSRLSNNQKFIQEMELHWVSKLYNT